MTPLRIGVDAREILGNVTGVGRYLGELLHRWTKRSDAATRRFVLYAPEPIPAVFHAEGVDVRIVAAPRLGFLSPNGRGTWWEQIALMRTAGREPLDVFFAPGYTAPLRLRAPLAVTIHDLSFAAHPEWFRRREGIRRRWLTARTGARADVIFTDSEFSKAEIHSRLGIERERIRVIPPGVTAPLPPAGLSSERDPLVLYVGSLFNRRRLPDVIAAFAQATRELPQARLVIVGENRTWPVQDLAAVATSHGVADRAALRSYVADQDLASLYARASVFVFLSEYEGFGLTPLEALSAGVPIVVLDTPVAREVYGPAAVYVAPDDTHGAATAIRELLTTAAARTATLVHAPDVLARYSWDQAAEATLGEIERIGRRGR